MVRNRQAAIIDHDSDVGGYPSYRHGTAPLDRDGDGIPDAWERVLGSDPLVADAAMDHNGDGYNTIENWAHAMMQRRSVRIRFEHNNGTTYAVEAEQDGILVPDQLVEGHYQVDDLYLQLDTLIRPRTDGDG